MIERLYFQPENQQNGRTIKRTNRRLFPIKTRDVEKLLTDIHHTMSRSSRAFLVQPNGSSHGVHTNRHSDNYGVELLTRGGLEGKVISIETDLPQNQTLIIHKDDPVNSTD